MARNPSHGWVNEAAGDGEAGARHLGTPVPLTTQGWEGGAAESATCPKLAAVHRLKQVGLSNDGARDLYEHAHG